MPFLLKDWEHFRGGGEHSLLHRPYLQWGGGPPPHTMVTALGTPLQQVKYGFKRYDMSLTSNTLQVLILQWVLYFFSFLARDVIYTSRAYAMMQVSICLWRLCIVFTGCNGSRISLHAWIDGCLCYLLTTPHPDRRMGWCRDFWWKWGVWKN